MTRPHRLARRLVASAMVITYVSGLALAAPAPAPGPTGPGAGGSTGPRYPEGAIVASTAPIALPGEGNVSDGGAAGYDLPLWVPDGPNGMQPRLALRYGGGGNGAVGVGFHLAGLSAIAPCRRTFASDGYADNADFGIGELTEAGFSDSSKDAYCLDGIKLVPHAEPGFTLPATGFVTQLHTEVESFVHVLAHRALSTDVQPTKYTAHRPDGSVATYLPIYGNLLVTGDARTKLQAGDQQVAIVYLLADETDRNGNRIVYTYSGADASGATEVGYRLERIDYSFAGGALPRRKIKLLYEPRPDLLVRYVRGVKVVSRSRLASIEAWAPNPTTTQKVWSYSLRYLPSPDTGRSLLSSVQLCEVLGGCSWVRSFDWTTAVGGAVDEQVLAGVEFDGASMSYDQASLDWYRATENLSANWLKPTDTRLMLFDLDGDGDDDALYRTRPSWVQAFFAYWSGYLAERGYNRISGQLKVRISSETQPLGLMDYEVTDLLEPRFSYPGAGETGDISAYANLGKSRVADVDGDGQLDLVLARTQIIRTNDEADGDQTNWDTWRYGFFTYLGRRFEHFSEKPFLPGQDGLDTVAMHGPVLRWDAQLGRSLIPQQPPFQRVYADLDGDARVEAIEAFDQDLDLLDHLDVDWNDPTEYVGAGFPYKTRFSTDGGSGPTVPFAQSWTCGNGHAIVTDLDGDGRQDALVADDTKAQVPTIDPITGSPGVYRRLSVGDPWSAGGPRGDAAVGDTSKLWAGGCGGVDPDLVLGDWNGDGLEDALYPPGSYGGNTTPLVRWNFGRGFGMAEPMPVTGAAGIAALMEQKVPIGRQGSPVAWDRGTRVADVDGDGRDDLIAVRQDLAACVDPVLALPFAPPVWGCEHKVVVFLSRGDSFAGRQVFSWSDGQASIAHGFTTAQIGDVNGDGAVDLVNVAGGRLRVLQLPWRTQPDRLAAVRDGGAAVPLETFTYSRAWWGDQPRNEATYDNELGPMPCAWPVACSGRGFPVVREHKVFVGTRLDGTAMYRTERHKFAGPRTSLLGRGHLGFNSHDIWQRESGIGVHRSFDNETPHDPEPGLMGGLFYPHAGRAKLEVTVTPRAPVPTVGELASSAIGPGLVPSAVLDVRTRWASSDVELRASDGGRLLTVLPSRTEVYDVENTAAPSLSSGTPTYGGTSWVGSGSRTQTTRVFDAYGAVTDETTTIGAGLGAPLVTRRTQTQVEHRPAAWLLGIPVRIATSSVDGDDAYTPTQVERRSYDAIGNLVERAQRATGPGFSACVLLTGNPAGCEEQATTTTYLPDAFGNVVAATTVAPDDPQPRATELEWDLEGVYPFRTTDALGFVTEAVHHPALGVPLLDTDAVGVTTTSTYDGFGRVRTVARPGEATLTRTYANSVVGNRRGLLVSDARTDGHQAYRRTDEFGRTVEHALLGFGSQWIYRQQEYGSQGQLVRVDNPGYSLIPTGSTTMVHDRLGQLLVRTGSDGAMTVVEPGLLATTTWDPEGHERYLRRDVAGRVTESGQRVGGGTEIDRVLFRHGPYDQVDRVTDTLGNQTTIEHDAFGRQVRRLDPDAGEQLSKYDGFGQRVYERRGNGAEFVNTFDALGRPLTRKGPDGMTVRSYDVGVGAAGKLTSVVSPAGVLTSHEYDSLGRPRGESQTYDGVTRSVIRRYDSLGRTKHVFYPEVPGFDRFTISYSYGSDGHLRGIRDSSVCHYGTAEAAVDGLCVPAWLWQVTGRNARLALTQATFGNGVTVNRSYDADTGRLEQLAAAGKTTTYEYDLDGQPIARVEPATGRTEAFAYADLHRLTGWTLTGPKSRLGTSPTPIATTYSYDAIGNLTKVMVGATTTFSASYGAGGRPHALSSSSVGGAASYDGAGRQLTGAGRTVAWNEFDLPRQITTGATARDFVYDGDGRRVYRVDPTSKITYLGRLYEHRDTQAYGQLDTFLVYGEPGVVAQVDYGATGKVTRYVVSDPIDSATLVVRSNGAVGEQAYFDPFGARISSTGAAASDADLSTSFGFTGHEEDGAGLVNMGGRIYDRTQYRFLSPDPLIGDPLAGQTYNPYSYVYNNPVRLRDPSGYQAVDETGGWVETSDDGASRTEVDWTFSAPSPAALNCSGEPPCINGEPEGIGTDEGGAVPATPNESTPAAAEPKPWTFEGPFGFIGAARDDHRNPMLEGLVLIGYDTHDGGYAGTLGGLGHHGKQGGALHAREDLWDFSSGDHETEHIFIVEGEVWQRKTIDVSLGAFINQANPREVGVFVAGTVGPVTFGGGAEFMMEEDPTEAARRTLASNGITLTQIPASRVPRQPSWGAGTLNSILVSTGLKDEFDDWMRGEVEETNRYLRESGSTLQLVEGP